MTEYQAFIFDFDGVLADSVNVKTEAFAKLFKSYGPEIEAKVVAYHLENGGMTRREKFRYYYRELLNKPLTNDEMERLCNTFSSLVVDDVVAAPEIPGAEEFLKKWFKKVSCFINSAAPDDEIKLILERRGIAGSFKEVWGSSKSKFENVKRIVNRYGFIHEKCHFFGDTVSDYKAAAAAGVPFIGILPEPDAPLLKFATDIRWYPDFYSIHL